MTTIVDRLVDVGGLPLAQRVSFSVPRIRATADGDPCNGLTALAQYPTGTTHTQALEALEGDS